MHRARRLFSGIALVGCLVGSPARVVSQDRTHVEISESPVAANTSSVSASFTLDLRVNVAPGDTVTLHTCQGSPRYQVLTYEADGSIGALLQRSYCPLAYTGAEELVGPMLADYSVPVGIQLGERSLWFISRADVEVPLTVLLVGESREVLSTPPFELRFSDSPP